MLRCIYDEMGTSHIVHCPMDKFLYLYPFYLLFYRTPYFSSKFLLTVVDAPGILNVFFLFHSIMILLVEILINSFCFLL